MVVWHKPLPQLSDCWSVCLNTSPVDIPRCILSINRMSWCNTFPILSVQVQRMILLQRCWTDVDFGTVAPYAFKSIKLLCVLSLPNAHLSFLARSNGIVNLSVKTRYYCTQIWKPNQFSLRESTPELHLGANYNNEVIAGKDTYTGLPANAAFGAKRTLRQMGKTASLHYLPGVCLAKKKKKARHIRLSWYIIWHVVTKTAMLPEPSQCLLQAHTQCNQSWLQWYLLHRALSNINWCTAFPWILWAPNWLGREPRSLDNCPRAKYDNAKIIIFHEPLLVAQSWNNGNYQLKFAWHE